MRALSCSRGLRPACRTSRWSAVPVALAALCASGPAIAQQTAQAVPVALDRFDPAPAGDRMFGVESPFAAGEGTPHVELVFDYAHNPYTLGHGPGVTAVNAVVGDQLFLHLNASVAILHRLTLNFEVPAAVVQSGENPVFREKPYTSPKDAAFGDVRLGARVTVFGAYEDPFQVALSGYVWIPSGAADEYLTDGKVRGMPSLVLGGHAPWLNWSFTTGIEFRPKLTTPDGIQLGSQVLFGGGIGVLFLDDRAQVGPEVKAAVQLQNSSLRNTNGELMLDVRYRLFDDFELGVGVGSGLTSGFGTPDMRMIGMLAFSPKMKVTPPDRDGDGVPDAEDACPDVPAPRAANPKKPGCPAPADRDGDGIPDEEDACPDQPGVASTEASRNGCPADRDGDGIPDDKDACPDQPGPPNEDPKKNGCPPPKDTDGDGIPDAEDACPTIPGVRSNDPAKNGCPGDRDGDGIPDDVDACPDVPGVPSKDPRKNGCPRAQISDKGIEIAEQVDFDTGTANIRSSSDALLDEVANICKAHEEIVRIEVAGYTDNQGAKVANKQLSQQRADAVKKALVARGIDRLRLVAKGYGEESPIADNATEEGRAKNRRVQFVILEKKKAGEGKAAPKKAAPKAPKK
jgi:outer membrane protein OmpA-like peptidoglycan-associated protein